MFAIAFDLVVADAARFHPKNNATAAYADIKKGTATAGAGVAAGQAGQGAKDPSKPGKSGKKR